MTAIRIAARGPGQVLPATRAPAAVVETGALGFRGAAADDSRRWLAGFRTLLDSLDAPLQVVICSRPGAAAVPASQPTALPDSTALMRAADLDFASRLRDSASAHQRSVTLVSAPDHAPRIVSQLCEVGLTSSEVVVASDENAAGLYGQEESSAFLDARGWHRTWYLERFPGSDLEAGWLLKLLPPGHFLSLSWHALPIPSSWAIHYLQRQLVSMRAARMHEGLNGAVDPHLAGAVPNAEELQRRLTASQERAFHVGLYLTLTADSRARLESGTEQVIAAARAALCQLEPCTLRMLDGRLATLPLGVDHLQRYRVLDTSSLVTLFPWFDADLQQRDGLVLGHSRATGAPVALDVFDQGRYANANIGVFGHSGAGKTYLLSTIALGALGVGAQVFIVDPEHEYGRLAEPLGGVSINLAVGSGHAINVLRSPPPGPPQEAWLGPAVADTVDLVSVVCGGLDEPERATLEKAVRAAYAEVSQPVLGDVANRLPAASRVGPILERWVQGSLGAIFSAPTNVDLDAPIVVFGMRELREEMVGPVHFLLAEALWSRIKARDRRRVLIIDELGLLFEDPTMRRFVVSLARRIRKYDGALVFATQNPGDLLSSEAGSVVATNPATLFLGAQRPGEALKLQRTFQLSEAQRSMLESSRRGDFLLAAGSDRLALRVQAPPWQAALMTAAREPTIASV